MAFWGLWLDTYLRGRQKLLQGDAEYEIGDRWNMGLPDRPDFGWTLPHTVRLFWYYWIDFGPQPVTLTLPSGMNL